MREEFRNDLKDLKEEVSFMMDKVYDIVDKSINYLMTNDYKKAKSIKGMDDCIDSYMDDIEEKVVELIALQQPMAKDLRALFAISKMVTDLERIGDFAVNIAKETINIGQEEHIEPIYYIPKMKVIILDMLSELKLSLMKKDVKKAYEIAKLDENIDMIYKDLYNHILILINKDSNYINQGTKLLFVGRYLERMADHITNICERIIYIHKGEKVDIN